MTVLLGPTYQILDVPVSTLTRSELSEIMNHAVEGNSCVVIGSLNLHSMYVYHHNEKMRSFFNKTADYIHIDGMGVVFLGRLLGLPLRPEHRVTYMDSLLSLIDEWARKGWRVFYLGSAPGVAAMGAALLKNEYPTLQIAVQDGYFNAEVDSDDNKALLAQINAFKPNVLLVGMGVPRQESWILENTEHIKSNVILTSGATMDYVAGVIPRQPEWAGRWCLNWLFRLIAEPKKLWRRYLVEPWYILKMTILHVISR